MAEVEANKELVTEEESKEVLPEGEAAGGKQAESARSVPATKGSKKWIVFSVLLLILIISVITIKFSPDFFNGHDKEIFIQTVDINDDNLSEEILPPFFIPPSNESSRGAIRIDFSVIWDGLASIRFGKKELRIRSDLSKFITDFADKTDDLNENIPFLEQEMSAFFRNALGVRDLAIKIKEIRYL